MEKHVVISGASGFIGKELTLVLLQKGYKVIALSRNVKGNREHLPARLEFVRWDAKSAGGWWQHVEGAKAIINLAGENIGGGYWTAKRKERILQSRLNAGSAVSDAIEKVRDKPGVLVQPSGVNYYGTRGDQILDEDSAAGRGFLTEVTKRWEESSRVPDAAEMRLVVTRFGVVLGKSGGFLPRLALPFRLFMGSYFGDGSNWFSWIHIDDLVRAVIFLIENEELAGTYNMTAPNPLPSKDFYFQLAAQLNRSLRFRIPRPLLEFLLGEMARELILVSQRVIPRRLLDAGFEFLYPDAKSALEQIFSAR